VRPVRCRGESGPAVQDLVRCRFFELQYLQATQPFLCGGEGRLQALIVLGGSATLAGPEGSEPLARGQTWVFPARMPAWKCHPAGTLQGLLCTLPTPPV
jgi:hypothetical protein